MRSSLITRGAPMLSLRRELDDLFSNFFGEGEDGGWFTGQFQAPIDLSETDSTVEVRIDLPGMKPKELDIQLSGETLKISGRREEEHEEKDRTVHRSERRSGSFCRCITLPTSVKQDGVDAQYHNGVLTVTMQKTEESKPKKISVKG